MSAGNFETTGKYENNFGDIYRCRYQPETEDCTIDSVPNDAPVAAPTVKGTIRLGTGRREFGVTPRRVKLEFTGAKPSGYSGDTAIVVALTPTFFNACDDDKVGTYLGVPVKVVRRFAEEIK